MKRPLALGLTGGGCRRSGLAASALLPTWLFANGIALCNVPEPHIRFPGTTFAAENSRPNVTGDSPVTVPEMDVIFTREMVVTVKSPVTAWSKKAWPGIFNPRSSPGIDKGRGHFAAEISRSRQFRGRQRCEQPTTPSH